MTTIKIKIFILERIQVAIAPNPKVIMGEMLGNAVVADCSSDWIRDFRWSCQSKKEQKGVRRHFHYSLQSLFSPLPRDWLEDVSQLSKWVFHGLPFFSTQNCFTPIFKAILVDLKGIVPHFFSFDQISYFAAVTNEFTKPPECEQSFIVSFCELK